MNRLLQLDEYTIGWVCGLPLERAAAEQILDEEHQDPAPDRKDDYLYTFGSIYDDSGGQHNIVIACLPAGRLGAESAASVAAQMKAKFISLRFGLMVGIGGGVPCREVDIRLGDVVVSQPYGDHGGVIQYDSGGKGPNNSFTRTGQLNSPPTILLSAITKLGSNHHRGRTGISKHLAKFTAMQDFVRPQTTKDVLFEQSYTHIDEGKTCASCDLTRAVKRSLRSNNDIVVHYGTIASGNTIIKDAATRDKLSGELGGIYCFEMEAAGLMNTFPCLVIRGICDYADSHTNSNWQSYAAATAAAYAKELLSAIPAVYPEITKERLDNEKKEIESWVKSWAVKASHSKFLSASKLRWGHTCQWVKSDERFTWWQVQEKSAMLWLTGLPGIGKTTLTTFMVEILNHEVKAATPQTCVIFTLCGDQIVNSAEEILKNSISQLVDSLPFQWQRTALEQRTKLHGEVDFRTLWTLFIQIVQMAPFKCIYVVIDGLDECESGSMRDLLTSICDFLVSMHNELESVGQGRHPWTTKVLFLLSSRPVESVRDVVEDYPDYSFRMLATEANYTPILEDVSLYVKECILPKLKNFRSYSDEQGELIQEHLTSRPTSMFLYAKLVFETLKETPADRMEEVLAQKPADLDEFYRHVLEKINTATRSRQSDVLLCLMYAFRPLELDELYFALYHKKGFTWLRRSQEKSDMAALKSDLCLFSPLITYRETNGEVEFCHNSAKEYLLTKANSLHPPYNHFLATKCVAHTYLATGCLSLLTQSAKLEYPTKYDSFWSVKLEALRRDVFLLVYALDYWVDHCRQSIQDEEGRHESFELLNLLYTLNGLRRTSGTESFWAAVIWRSNISLPTNKKITELTSVEFFSALGVSGALTKALQEKKWVPPDRLAERHSSALELAVRNGNLRTLEVLLGSFNLSLLDSSAHHGITISAAEQNNFPLFMKTLRLRPNLDLEEIAGSILQAVIHENDDILRELSEIVWKSYHVSIGSLCDNAGMTVLHLLCASPGFTKSPRQKRKFLQSVQVLMNYGGDINAEDNLQNTPLHYLCMIEPSPETVHGLIALGADPKLQSKAGWLPYHIASRRATQVETLQALASTDSQSVHMKTVGGFTALHWAAQRNSFYDHSSIDGKIIRHLLNLGLDPLAQTNKGKTPVQIAATDGSLIGFQWAYTIFDGIEHMHLTHSIEWGEADGDMIAEILDDYGDEEDIGNFFGNDAFNPLDEENFLF